MSAEEGVSKDPMRDSLMSNSSDEDFSDEDTENNNTPVGGSFVDNSVDLDLEYDLWQGQFEITKPPARGNNGHTFYKDIVKTVSIAPIACRVDTASHVRCSDGNHGVHESAFDWPVTLGETSGFLSNHDFA